MGYHIAKGVSERCIARLLLTTLYRGSFHCGGDNPIEEALTSDTDMFRQIQMQKLKNWVPLEGACQGRPLDLPMPHNECLKSS